MVVEYNLQAWKWLEHKDWFIYVYKNREDGENYLSPQGFSYPALALTIVEDWSRKNTKELPRLISQSPVEMRIPNSSPLEPYTINLCRPLTPEELNQIGSELVKLLRTGHY